MSSTRVFVDADEYARCAELWRLGEPFPVLRSAELARFESLLDSAGRGPVPEVVGRHWSGLVMSFGNAAGCAHLLAAATGRRHHHFSTASELERSLLAHASEPIALVALASELHLLGFWPGDAAEQVGLVTAAEIGALSALVLRIVTSGTASHEIRAVADPTIPRASDTAPASFPEFFRIASQDRVLLTVSGHGRECCIASSDGIICGASSVLAPPAKTSGRAPACLRGAGCYRHDLDDSQRRMADTINSTVVFANSCLAVSVGVNAYPLEVNVGLRFLSGTAVAVVGPVGVHVSSASYEALFREQMSSGQTLGAALRELNRHASETSGFLARFGLLGDPGLTPIPVSPHLGPESDVVAGRPNRSPTPARTVAEHTTHGGTPGRGPGVLDRLTALQESVVPRLRSLSALGLPVDEVRVAALERGLASAKQALAPSLEVAQELEVTLDDLQRHLLTDVIDAIQGTWWDLFGRSASAFRQVSQRTVRCPHCSTLIAAEVVLEHRVDERLRMSGLVCTRCGDLEWATHSTPALTHTIAREWTGAVGTEIPLRSTVTSQVARDVRAHVGFAVVGGFNVDIPTVWRTAADLVAGSSADLAWSLDLTAPFAFHDEHRAMLVSVAAGVCRFSQVYIGVVNR